MKKGQSLKSLIYESKDTDDIFKFITEPDTQFTDKHKATFLENVKNFNKMASSVYRKISLKDITKQIQTLGKVAERLIMTETDEWFDQVSLKRDAKTLAESVKLFEKTALEIHHLQNRLESSFEDIGYKLNRYFKIDDSNEFNDDIVQEITT